MRVLNVNVLIDPISGGGCGERTVQISRNFRDRGIETAILTTDLGITPERLLQLQGVKVTALSCLSKRFFIPAVSLRSLNALVGRVDMVHIMGHWTILNALIYLVCRHVRKPYVVCPAGALPIFGRSKWLKRIYNLLIGKKIIQGASRCIAISVDEIAHFSEYGVPRSNVVMIPNGVNLSEFEISDSSRFLERIGRPSSPIILFVGRLNYIKGPDILLDAFCNIKDRFPAYNLVFAGPDEGMLPILSRVAATSNVSDRVHFVGYIGGREKIEAYLAASALVIPSRQEAMSIVVLEAGAAGIPVLLTEKCGFNDIDRSGGGKVVPATIEGIQQGLAELLSKPSDLKKMGSLLKEFVSSRYTWDSIGQEYRALYDDILSGSQP